LDEERIENSDESNGDDEKSSPESRVHRSFRVHRRFSKPVEQKYKIVHAESTRHQDSDISISLSGSKSKQPKKN
jgi:hypothetical protein